MFNILIIDGLSRNQHDCGNQCFTNIMLCPTDARVILWGTGEARQKKAGGAKSERGAGKRKQNHELIFWNRITRRGRS